ncbi:MAG TPA: class I SAM-dependent methyltransferase, partial [Candidatus Dormibacteraeota bacterium]|nr:class I SAM-dependent methyltransferase [Candidatus Dormibacteraeota bacterium]
GGLWCTRCSRTFPEVAGIPDLRISSDRYLSLEEDREKARRLAELRDLSFAELVAAYWRMTPETPPDQAARFAAATADGVRRGAAWLDADGPLTPGERVLDIGCCTGGLVVAAAQRGAAVTGVDIALRWLVVARRLCEEHGVDAQLVAADGALLPFRGATFDRTLCVETVEHTDDQQALLQSALLSVRQGGAVRVVVANRLSVAPDPVARLVGLGYLPRPLAAGYVRLRGRGRYGFYRPVSAARLRSLVGLRDDVRVDAAPLPPPPVSASGGRRAAQRVYGLLRKLPLVSRLLTTIGPFLEASGRVRES